MMNNHGIEPGAACLAIPARQAGCLELTRTTVYRNEINIFKPLARD